MKVKKMFLSIFVFCALLLQPSGSFALAAEQNGDSTRLNDIIVTLLMPPIQNAVNEFYRPYLDIKPTVVPFVGSNIVKIEGGERIREGINNSHYIITIDVLPYVGPHLSVGKDRIVLDIQPDGIVTVKDYTHLESYQLTPNYQSLLKKKLP